MLAALFIVYLSFGVMLSAIPPMVNEVRASLEISRSEIGLALGAWPLIYILTAPPAGRIIDRIGVNRAIRAGLALIVFAGVVQASAQGAMSLWIGVAIVGIGGPLISASAPKLVADWFPNPAERRLAVGVYTSAPALGGVIALALTNSVLLPLLGDWRRAILSETALCFAALISWLIVNNMAPLPPVEESGDVAPSNDGSVGSLLRSRGVRLALVLGAGSFFVNQALTNWLPSVLEEDSGMSAGAASSIAAVSLAIGIMARLSIPGLAQPGRRTMVLNSVMAVMALSLIAMTLGGPVIIVIAALMLGVRSALNSLVIVVLMEADGVTRSNLGRANGLWFSIAGIGGAAGPLAVGLISDSDAGFDGGLMVLAAVLCAMVIVTAAHGRHARRRIRAESHPPPSDPFAVH